MIKYYGIILEIHQNFKYVQKSVHNAKEKYVHNITNNEVTSYPDISSLEDLHRDNNNNILRFGFVDAECYLLFPTVQITE